MLGRSLGFFVATTSATLAVLFEVARRGTESQFGLRLLFQSHVVVDVFTHDEKLFVGL